MVAALRSKRYRRKALLALAGLASAASGLLSATAGAVPYSFSTGTPDAKMAMGSRPGGGGVVEIEAADDFTLEGPTILASASFTGLVPAMGAGSVQEVRVEAYRGFPADSDTSRTSGAPIFSTASVPTRVDSPADMVFAQADSAEGTLTYTVSTLGGLFALNSVLNGINPKPSQATGGDGPFNGDEVVFNVSFSPPLSLPAGHYFFVPQVKLSSGDFYWLSTPRSPPPLGTVDAQAWIRNASLAPDWLRVGTDIVGGAPPPTFNAAFSLAGVRCLPLSVSPSTLPAAVAGHSYSASLEASGGVAPYAFSASGALPPGLSLTSGGMLSGAPTGAGFFQIAVTVASADGCTGHADLTLTVRAAGTAGPGASPPDTKITKAKINPRRRAATFRFKAIGGASGFQCALARRHQRKPKFRKCRSPKSYRHLRAGRYTFSVRAVGSAGADPTPAKRKFKIVAG